MATKDDPLGWAGATIDGRFVVEQLVGEGGFGTVYKGTHLGLGVPIAIKCLRLPSALGEGDRESFLQDFKTEARLLHQLSRKTAGIVQALDVGAAVSPRGLWTPYIVMEWLEGESLEDDLAARSKQRRGTRTLREAVALLAPVAAALEIAHADRIAHLDVKPGNVFLGSDGTIKLLDFGIAKILSSNDALATALTRSGSVGAFTPVYAAPEQFNRRHGVKGPWTDVFALALVLIEVCSGEHALAGDNPIQLYVASANDQYRPSLGAHGVKAPRAVEDVIACALDVDPRRRFPTAGAYAEALRQAMETVAASSTAVVVSIPARVSVQAPVSVREMPTTSATAHTARPGAVGTSTTGLNRVCTVLFAELTEPTEAAELDPEQLSSLVERSMGLLEACIDALGGTVERLVGDSIMAVFGLYGDSLGAPERAVYAALRMNPALSSTGASRRARPALAVRVGITTGRVFAGAQHASTGVKLTVAGPPVKLAARLQQGAAPGTVLVDRDTHRHVAGLFDAVAVERQTDHTHPTGSKAYRIQGIARDAHALNVTAARDFCGLATRFVGRTAEMETVAAAAETAVSERHARFVTLLGGAGVGKSRLLAEIADRREQASSWIVLAAQCSPLHVRVSYALAAKLIRGRFHIHEDDAFDVAEAKVRRGLFALRGLATVDQSKRGAPAMRLEKSDATHADEIVSQLLCLLGLGSRATHGPTGVSEEASRAKHRIAAAVASLVRWADRPIVVVCDDIHWADEASLTLLEDVCIRLRDAPFLVVATARPDELLERRPLWGEGESWHERVAVGAPLRRHLEEMTRDRLRHVPDLSAAAVKLLTDHADQSPLTLVETLHLLVDSGVIDTSHSGRWEIQQDRLGQLALPTTVHGIVQARLDRLDDPARNVLASAAVAGRTFWDGLVIALSEAGAADCRSILADLRERGFVRARAGSTFPDEQEYVFAEAAIQRVAYDTLSRKDRERLHRIVACWLAERTTMGSGDALVASHFERAGAFADAIAAYRRAGTHASTLGQNAEALHCLERAAEIDDAAASGDAETEPGVTGTSTSTGDAAGTPSGSWVDGVGLRIELGDVLRHAGRYDDAESRYRQAAARIAANDERGHEPPDVVAAWRARIDYRLATVERLRGRFPEARALLESALRAAVEARLEEERAQILMLVASLHRREGRPDECRRACTEGLRVCRSIERRVDRRQETVAKLLNVLGSLFLDLGKLVRSERCYLQAARVVDASNAPHLTSHCLNNVAVVRYKRGDLAGALGCFERVLALADTAGDLWMRTTALANLGEVLLEMDRIPEAREHLDEATRLGERIRAHLDLPDVYRNLARAHLSASDLGAAIDAVRRGLELVATTSAKVYAAAVLATVVEVCAAARRDGVEPAARERAAVLAREALDLSRTAGAPLQDAALRELSVAAAGAPP